MKRRLVTTRNEDGTVKYRIFDTAKSDLIGNAHNHGEGWETTLYRTKRGRWFFVKWSATGPDYGADNYSFEVADETAARNWLLKHEKVDELETHFPNFVKENFEEA
jgi:hypothetical protein